MEEAKTIIPHWAYQILGAIASFLVGGGAVKAITIYLNRNKPRAEVHESEARATEITVRSHSTAGDAVIRMMERLEETQGRIDDIRDDRDDYKMRWELRGIELVHRESEIRHLMAIIDVNGIRLQDYDHLKQKRIIVEITERENDETTNDPEEG